MSAPIKGPLRPLVQRFGLGDFEVTSILDARIVRDGLSSSHGGNASASEVQAITRSNRIAADRYEHPFTPSLINTGDALILFDTGIGSLQREYEQFRGRLPDGLLAQRLSYAGYSAADIDVVVITHGHPDHIGGLMEDGRPVFPNARYVFGATEFDYWTRGDVREARKFNRELFLRVAVPLAERATFIKPGDEIAPGIHAVDAAGHSAGMLAYLIESKGQRILNWADTCSHFVVSVQRPEIHADVDDDKEKAVATRKRILDMAATDEMFVLGFHMPFPGLGSVERTATGYRWVPHSYQLNL